MIGVTAAIVERDGLFLICRRPEGKRLAGKWEFPGGKMEEGETPEEGLKRELFEELGFEARPYQIFDARLESGGFLVLYYFTQIASGEPAALEHSEIRWVPMNELYGYEYSGADAEMVKKLMAAGTHGRL